MIDSFTGLDVAGLIVILLTLAVAFGLDQDPPPIG